LAHLLETGQLGLHAPANAAQEAPGASIQVEVLRCVGHFQSIWIGESRNSSLILVLLAGYSSPAGSLALELKRLSNLLLDSSDAVLFGKCLTIKYPALPLPGIGGISYLVAVLVRCLRDLVFGGTVIPVDYLHNRLGLRVRESFCKLQGEHVLSPKARRWRQ
jgi:hypothetical protein